MTPAARLYLTKNLPSLSIGGGSADAAAALRLLTSFGKSIQAMLQQSGAGHRVGRSRVLAQHDGPRRGGR